MAGRSLEPQRKRRPHRTHRTERRCEAPRAGEPERRRVPRADLVRSPDPVAGASQVSRASGSLVREAGVASATLRLAGDLAIRSFRAATGSCLALDVWSCGAALLQVGPGLTPNRVLGPPRRSLVTLTRDRAGAPSGRRGSGCWRSPG